MSSVSRSGFETKLTYNGYAKYVYVEAVDRHGETLGKSKVIETIAGDDMSSVAIEEETKWLQGEDSDENAWTGGILSHPMVAFGGGIVCGIVAFLVIVFARRRGFPWQRGRGRKGPIYQRVAEADAWEFDEAKLDDLSPSGTRRRGLDSDAEFPEDVVEDDSDERGRHNRTPSTGESSAG